MLTAEVAVDNITVNPANTLLAPLTLSSPIFVTSDLSVATSLTRTDAPQGAIASANLLFTLTAPGGSTATSTATTSAAGGASILFLSLSQFGLYSLVASYPGTACLNSSATVPIGVAVPQRTALSAGTTSSGTCGSTVTVSATLTSVPQSRPLVGLAVLFSGGSNSCNGFTDVNGSASCSVPVPNNALSAWSVTATFAGMSFVLYPLAVD